MARRLSHLQVLLVVSLFSAVAKASDPPATAAGLFLPKFTANGLFVHLGSRDGTLSLEIVKARNWLMHGLVADEKSLVKRKASD